MRDLILSRGPWTSEEQLALLDYCQSDVDALALLFEKMAPLIDWPRALLRGRYMKAVSKIQACGIPMDVDSLRRIQDSWDKVQDALIARIDGAYNVFEGQTFKANKFKAYLQRSGIPWPRLASGSLVKIAENGKRKGEVTNP